MKCFHLSELKYIRPKSKEKRLNYTSVSEFTYNEILFQIKAVPDCIKPSRIKWTDKIKKTPQIIPPGGS